MTGSVRRCASSYACCGTSSRHVGDARRHPGRRTIRTTTVATRTFSMRDCRTADRLEQDGRYSRVDRRRQVPPGRPRSVFSRGRRPPRRRPPRRRRSRRSTPCAASSHARTRRPRPGPDRPTSVPNGIWNQPSNCPDEREQYCRSCGPAARRANSVSTPVETVPDDEQHRRADVDDRNERRGRVPSSSATARRRPSRVRSPPRSMSGVVRPLGPSPDEALIRRTSRPGARPSARSASSSSMASVSSSSRKP